MRTRNLKVGYNTRMNGTTHNNRATKFFPQLVLQGDWMQNAGFKIGDQTEVIVREGYLEIRKREIEEKKEAAYQRAYEHFIADIDNQFYEGYAVRLAEENHTEFNNQLNQFIINYNYENI